MAGLSSILSAQPHIPFYDNKIANLKALFVYGFNIKTANPDLFNKWVTHKFNICTTTIIKDYELWACNQIDFNKFEAKYFDILDSST